MRVEIGPATRVRKVWSHLLSTVQYQHRSAQTSTCLTGQHPTMTSSFFWCVPQLRTTSPAAIIGRHALAGPRWQVEQPSGGRFPSQAGHGGRPPCINVPVSRIFHFTCACPASLATQSRTRCWSSKGKRPAIQAANASGHPGPE